MADDIRNKQVKDKAEIQQSLLRSEEDDGADLRVQGDTNPELIAIQESLYGDPEIQKAWHELLHECAGLARRIPV